VIDARRSSPTAAHIAYPVERDISANLAAAGLNKLHARIAAL
jgi:hypothetical protein